MASLYAHPSRPSTPLQPSVSSKSIVRSASATSTKRVKQHHHLRSIYRNSAKAFLVADFATTAAFLSDAKAIHVVDRATWLDRLVAVEDGAGGSTIEDDEVELKRKLDILRITLLATIKASVDPVLPLPDELALLLDLPASNVLASLWFESIGLQQQQHSMNDILPTPEASTLHPSLAIALVLGALKMKEPRVARSIAEAWFGSTSEELDSIVSRTALNLDLQSSFGIEERGMSMVSSTMKEKAEPRTALVGSWIRLMDLLTLYVLPLLGEWEAAGDFIRFQGIDNGGWIPESRVEDALARLEQLQIDEATIIINQRQRQKDQEIAKLEKAKEKERERRRSEKGKGRAKDAAGAPTSSPILHAESRGDRMNGRDELKEAAVVSIPAASGFASLRTTLSTFLARPASTSSSLATRPAFSLSLLLSSPLSIVDYIRHHAFDDPIRLVSIIFTLFALSSWLRSKLAIRSGAVTANQRSGVRSRILGVKDMFKFGVTSLGETIKMATKVTSL